MANPATSLETLGNAIIGAVENVVKADWPDIQSGATSAAKILASVSIDLADPNNKMTPDEKSEIMGDKKDSLKNAILFGEVVTEVVAEQAIDAAVQAIVTALPALVGIA